MDIHEFWEKAVRQTEIIRTRVSPLSAHADTNLPYIFLAESSINMGDSIIRKGEILVEKPCIILQPNHPQFDGFKSEEGITPDLDTVANFFLVRGVRFPSLRYNNKTESLDVYEGKLKEAIEHYRNKLEREENIFTGLVVGPEECWQFSLLIFIVSQVTKQADMDIKKLLDDMKKGEL